VLPNALGVSRPPPTRLPTVKTDAQLPQLGGSAASVSVRPVRSKLRHKAREMSGKGRVIFDNCVSMQVR
jgi:hypothetical protein